MIGAAVGTLIVCGSVQATVDACASLAHKSAILDYVWREAHKPKSGDYLSTHRPWNGATGSCATCGRSRLQIHAEQAVCQETQ